MSGFYGEHKHFSNFSHGVTLTHYSSCFCDAFLQQFKRYLLRMYLCMCTLAYIDKISCVPRLT